MTSIRRIYAAACLAVMSVVFMAWPVFAAMDVNIKSVVQIFLDNPIRAEQIYMNKEVQTEGEIVEIRRGDNGGFVIILKDIGAGGLDNYYFHCWLAEESVNRASSLSKGHRIGIRGTVYDFHQRERGIFIEGNIVSLSESVITHVLTQEQANFIKELNAARSGNMHSQFNLAMKYASGDGVEKNFTEAARWFREAANRGHSNAKVNLGILYKEGKGVNQNYSEAVKLFQQAGNNPYAIANLGLMYEEGKGVAKDINKAKNLYHELLINNQDSINNQGIQLALARLKLIAEQDIDVQIWLGDMYYNGRNHQGKGIERNLQEAMKWYRLAAGKGHSGAIYMLGWMNENGYGTAKNLNEAEKLYKLAADKGNSNAAFRLYKIYDGKNDDKYLLDSIRYLKQAHNSGHKEAIAEYDKKHKKLLEVMQMISKLKTSAAQGNKDAKQALAKINAEIDSKIGRETFNAVVSEFNMNPSAFDTSVSAQSSSPSGQYIITGDKVNVRSAPNTSARVIIQLNTGDPVTVIQTSRKGGNVWYKVRTSGGTSGWVFGQYISRN